MTDAKIIAEKLLQVKAVALKPQGFFTWASGWKSPIYCDNRKVLSHPYVRDFIKSELCNVLFEQFETAQGLAGVATAGIPWGAMAADQLKLPFIYVRPKPKEHGLGNQIEGDVQPGQKMVVIEDLISTGKSSLQAVDALLEKGVDVVGLVSIFNYGFPIAQQEFEKRSIKYYSLTNYTELLSLSLEKGIITESERSVLEQWRKNPAEWGK